MEKQIEEMAWDLCDIPRHPSIKSCEQCGNKHCHAMYYAERAYNADYRKQEWISVEERLPDDGVWVLGYSAKSRRGGLCNCLKSYVREFGNYDDTTHWMPLPEPPKGDAE